MIRAAKVDANQKEIVAKLRAIGATVLITSQLKNCFDILVGFEGVNYIMEIKDPAQPPSKRRLTEGEQKFKDSWRGGTYHIIHSFDECLLIINS